MERFELNRFAKEFLMYSYFGFSYGDIGKRDKYDIIIKKCTHVAYRDLARTVKFSQSAKQLNATEKKNLIESVEDYIAGEVSKKDINADFDKWHCDSCEGIINKMNSGDTLSPNSFTYGQAQKWLNMTIKYMWLLGLLGESFKDCENKLHVPADSVIIEAVWENKEVYLPLKPNAKREKSYNSDKVIPWSKWDFESYKKFQSSLREYVSKKDPPEIPLEWEAKAWITHAPKRTNGREQSP
ncbi:MAG: hypothetical protein PUF72_03470 [Clostridiales bacterium]|nr:hypothetical protein [Clostridiales bacterium]